MLRRKLMSEIAGADPIVHGLMRNQRFVSCVPPCILEMQLRAFHYSTNTTATRSQHEEPKEFESETRTPKRSPGSFRSHQRREAPDSAIHARNALFKKAYKSEQELANNITFAALKQRVMMATVSYSPTTHSHQPTATAVQTADLPPFMLEIKIAKDIACRVVTNSPLVARWLLDEFRSHASALIWGGERTANQSAEAQQYVKKSYLHVHVNAEAKFLYELKQENTQSDDGQRLPQAISVWKFIPNISENLKLQHAAAAEQLHRRDLLVQSNDGGFNAMASAKFTEHRARQEARNRHLQKQLRSYYNKHRNPATGQIEGGQETPFSQRTLAQLKGYLNDHHEQSQPTTDEYYSDFEKFAMRLSSLRESEATWASLDPSGAAQHGYISGTKDEKAIFGGVDTEVRPMGGGAFGQNARPLSRSNNYTSYSGGHNAHIQESVVAADANKRADRLEQAQLLANRCAGISIGLRGALHTMLGERMGLANSVTSPSKVLGHLAPAVDVDRIIGAKGGSGSGGGGDTITPFSSPSALISAVVPSLAFSLTRNKATSDPTSSMATGKLGKVFWATVTLKDGGFAASWTQPKGGTGSSVFHNERSLASLYSNSLGDDHASEGSVRSHYYLGAHGDRLRESEMQRGGGFKNEDGDNLLRPREGGNNSGAQDGSSLRFLQLSANKQGPSTVFLSAKRDECVLIVDVDPISNADTVPHSVRSNSFEPSSNRDYHASKTRRSGCDVAYLSSLVSLTGRSNEVNISDDRYTGKSQMKKYAIDMRSPISPYDDQSGNGQGGGNSDNTGNNSWSPAAHDHFRRLQQDILRQLEAVFVSSIVPTSDAAWCAGSGIVFPKRRVTSNTGAHQLHQGEPTDDEALLFVGPPGCGKTTMALHCLAASAGVLPNEQPVAGVAKPFDNNNNPGTTHNVKLLSCDSVCLMPSLDEPSPQSEDFGDVEDASRLAVVGFPFNPTLGLGSLMGTLFPNGLLDPVLLATRRLAASDKEQAVGRSKRMDDQRLISSAIVQENVSRLVAQRIAEHGEPALWTWDKKFGIFSSLVSSNPSSLTQTIGTETVEEERLDALVTEKMAQQAPMQSSSADASHLAFNPMNIDALYRLHEAPSASTRSPASAWQCSAGTLRYLIVLNWSRLPSANNQTTPSPTFIRKLTDEKDVERVLGADMVRAQTSAAENQAKGADDSALGEAEAEYILSGGEDQEGALSLRSDFGQGKNKRSSRVVSSVSSMSAAIMSAASADTVSMPLTNHQLLEQLVANADTKANKIYQNDIVDTDDHYTKRRESKLAITLDAQTRFLAFSGTTAGGETSSTSVGDGTRDVGLVKRNIFLDEAAVPPIVFDSESGEKVGALVDSLPSMIATSIARLCDKTPPPSSDFVECKKSDREDEATAKEEISIDHVSARRRPYAGIEVYEVTGGVNMRVVRDFALSLGHAI